MNKIDKLLVIIENLDPSEELHQNSLASLKEEIKLLQYRADRNRLLLESSATLADQRMHRILELEQLIKTLEQEARNQAIRKAIADGRLV